MRAAPFVLLVMLAASGAQAADWTVQTVRTPARVNAIETVGNAAEIEAGGLWYRLAIGPKGPFLTFLDTGPDFALPEGALPDSRVATGSGDIARAWLAAPTERYDHGVLGDRVEAGAIVIERRDGLHQTYKLGTDAVFEDLEPRIADLDADGRDEIVAIKSSLRAGSSLAVLAWRHGRYEILAETPPLGAPHRWLDVAGIADFTGAGNANKQVAIVRQPHAVGQLEIWAYDGKRLTKTAEFADTSNHLAGTRAIHMSAVADFDGDGIADLAVPSLDRTRLRLIGFRPQAHEIASVALPAKAVTDAAVVADEAGPAVAIGLEDGSLVVARRRR